MVSSLKSYNKKKMKLASNSLVEVVVVLCLILFPNCSLATKQQQPQLKHQHRWLQFGKGGELKILQVADMHYADGKTTPCSDVFESQLATCSDINTTAFLHRMILAEKPHLIVFTGIPLLLPFLTLQYQFFAKIFVKL